VTAWNAAKPAVVDDTAYLLHARHISTHWGTPYGFELFWYAEPLPAMQVLLPPVVPYWLALGIAAFGENLPLMKLWLFPFVLMLGLAMQSLLRRLMPFDGTVAAVVFLFSPVVLPMLNVMLDVPALALGLAGVAVFIITVDRLPGRMFHWRFVLCGLLFGLAMQAKYTMLFTQLVPLLYAITRRQAKPILPAILALITADIVFIGWEWWIHATAGESHFLHHAAGQGETQPLLEELPR